MVKAFTRQELGGHHYEVLHKGRLANADLFRFKKDGVFWVVKDFSQCLLPVQKIIGPLMVRREYRSLVHLQGIEGIPESPFMLDRYALCYRFIPGKTLRFVEARSLTSDFFHALESLVLNIHERNIVHLDVRNRRNILVSDAGRPALIDFQSSFHLMHVPKPLHGLLKDIDLSGVYKNWNMLRPDLLDEERRHHLSAMNRKRNYWIFKGYPLGLRRIRRR